MSCLSDVCIIFASNLYYNMVTSIRNLKSLYLIKFAKWFTLVMPIIIVFYQDNGLGMTDIMLLKSVYSVAVVCIEIPSGYCADVWGRKKTLVLGTFLAFVGFLVYSFSFGFWAFMVAEVVLGVGHSLISGADSALLYDSLKENEREDDYLKFEGKMTSLGDFAEAFAGIAGGLLAAYSLRLPFICQTVIAFIGVPAAFMLVEPKGLYARGHKGIKDILKVVKFAIVDNRQLRWNIVFSSVIGCSTLTMAWFVQPFFKEADIPLAYFGVLWTALNLSVGLTSMFAFRADKRFGQKKLSVLIGLGIGLGYVIGGLWISVYGLVVLFAFYLLRGVATPVLKDYINKITDSDVRATVLSIRNFIIRLLFAGIAPILGVLTDTVSLSTAMIISGCIFFILSIVSVIGIFSSKDIL